jgi:hypothetical protein
VAKNDKLPLALVERVELDSARRKPTLAHGRERYASLVCTASLELEHSAQ